MNSQVSESLVILPFFSCWSFPLTFAVGHESAKIHLQIHHLGPAHGPPYLHFILTIQSALGNQNQSVILFTCWLRDIRTPKWPSGHHIFQFNGNTGVYPKGIILPSKPVHITIAGMGGKQFARSLLDVTVRRVTPSSTPWFLDPCMLAVDERTPNIGYRSKHIVYPVRQNPMLLGYCLLAGKITYFQWAIPPL